MAAEPYWRLFALLLLARDLRLRRGSSPWRAARRGGSCLCLRSRAPAWTGTPAAAPPPARAAPPPHPRCAGTRRAVASPSAVPLTDSLPPSAHTGPPQREQRPPGPPRRMPSSVQSPLFGRRNATRETPTDATFPKNMPREDEPLAPCLKGTASAEWWFERARAL